MGATATVHGLLWRSWPWRLSPLCNNDPETDLSLHPNSPGCRLILNNILFPAAEKRKAINRIFFGSQSTFFLLRLLVRIALWYPDEFIYQNFCDLFWLTIGFIAAVLDGTVDGYCIAFDTRTPMLSGCFAPTQSGYEAIGVFDQFPFWFYKNSVVAKVVDAFHYQ